MSLVNSHWFDEEEDIAPELAGKRVKVNRIRYQQVKDALHRSRKYNLRNRESIAKDFDLHPSTVSKIKKAKSYNKYLKGRQNGKANLRSAESH